MHASVSSQLSPPGKFVLASNSSSGRSEQRYTSLIPYSQMMRSGEVDRAQSDSKRLNAQRVRVLPCATLVSVRRRDDGIARLTVSTIRSAKDKLYAPRADPVEAEPPSSSAALRLPADGVSARVQKSCIFEDTEKAGRTRKQELGAHGEHAEQSAWEKAPPGMWPRSQSPRGRGHERAGVVECYLFPAPREVPVFIRYRYMHAKVPDRN